MDETHDELADAFEYFVNRLRDAEQAVRSFDAYDGDIARGRGYLHIARMMLKSIEHNLLGDPEHPHFRVLDDRIREGGDNPDQRYLLAQIAGGEPYRVFGNRGSAARLEVQLYSEEPYGGKNVGVGYLPHEDIVFADDGSFSIDLGPGVSGPSTLVNPPAATIIQVRQIFDDWSDEDAGLVLIDRVGFEGHRKVSEPASQVAERFREAADNVFESTKCWPLLVQQGVVGFMEPNSLPPLMSPGDKAGVVGRWISLGPYILTNDTAVVITAHEVGADYQGVQLSDLWFSSLEYGNATSSISGAQATRDANGGYHYVISLEDPGYVNWLDPGGVDRGTVHLRFDGVRGEVPRDRWPEARVVSLAELASVIPGFDENVVDSATRDAQRSARRRHVQMRYRK